MNNKKISLDDLYQKKEELQSQIVAIDNAIQSIEHVSHLLNGNTISHLEEVVKDSDNLKDKVLSALKDLRTFSKRIKLLNLCQ
jgi:hypothetical protein